MPEREVQKPKKPIDYKKRLWKVFSEYVRRSSGNKCYTCGHWHDWKQMDAGHFIDKSICGIELYFSEKNVKAQCTKCNRYLSGNKDVYALKLIQEYGSGIIEDLFDAKQTISRWSDEMYISLIERYKSKLKEL